MFRHPARQRFGVGYFAGLLALGGGIARAQTGTIHAVVVNPVGYPIPGVEVTALGDRRSVRTDSIGRATIRALPVGPLSLSLRHLGYAAQQRDVIITGGDSDLVKITLVEQATQLDQVNVSAIGEHPFFAGFDQRRRQGIGTFITREQIDAHGSSTPSDIFRQVPQVRLIRANGGMGIRFPSSMTSIRRGPGAGLCAPMIWLDGQAAPGLEIDDLRSGDIQGIEVYRGSATTPPQFTSIGAIQCGAVVVWTRRKG